MSDHHNIEKQASEDVSQGAATSNANNFRGAISSHVNPRTGKLQLSLDAPVLPGIGGLHIDLGLDYVQRRSSDIILGLPSSWQFRLSYIDQSTWIVINGKQRYEIDSSWTSGMKYQSLHNMWLKTFEPTILPYGDKEQYYCYKLSFLSRKQQYFDRYGRLIAVADESGNCILFHYVDETDVYTTKLREIVDTYGQTTSFSYSNNVSPIPDIQVSLPEGGKNPRQFTYLFDDRGYLTGYRDPDERTTTIEYNGGQVEQDLVSKVTYPNNLYTEISYSTIYSRLSTGEQQQLDVVCDCSHIYSNATRTKKYDFPDRASSYNYTGNPEYPKQGAAQSSGDQLLTSNDNDFRYVTKVDNGVTITKHTYNNLHLELLTEVYTSGQEQELISRTEHQYPGEESDTFPPFQDLNANYQMPTQVTTRYFNTGDTDTCRATRTEKAYNDAGQVTDMKRYTSTDGQTFSLVQATSTTYNSLGQVLVQDVSDYRASGILSTTPVVTRLQHSFTKDRSLLESSAIGPVTAGAFSPALTTTYQYDKQGRVTNQSLASSDQGNPDAQVARHSTEYLRQNGYQLKIRRTDALHNVSYGVIDTTTGFLLSETDARGNTTQYTYDGRGRRTSKTDPLGITTQWQYDDGVNTVTVHHANDFEAILSYNGFGQLLKHEDNAGPDGGQRTLYRRSYDDVGRLQTETGVLGAPTTLTYAYDSRGQIESITDAAGNVKSFTHDAVAQTQTEYYNGVKTEIQTFDERRVVKREMQSTDSSGSTVTATGYDGHGRVVRTQVGPDDSQTGMVRTITFDALSKPVVVETRGGDGTTMHRVDERDVFGNIVRTTKSLNGGSESSTGTNAFDAVGRILTSETLTGGSEHFAHDPNGNLATRTDLSGNTFSYTYDASNALLSKSFTDGSVNKSLVHKYDSKTHRLIATELHANSDTESSISYEYTPDGKMTRASYGPGGPSLAWGYNQATGKLNSFTDATGVTTRYAYHSDGRLWTVSGPAGTATLSYYTKSENKAHSGRLKSVSFADTVTNYDYDGFGRIGTVTSTVGDATMVKVVYAYDPVTGNLVEKTFSSVLRPDDDNLNYSVSYQYNGLGHLVHETVKAGGETLAARVFTYDAAGNVSEIVTSGASATSGKTSFAYDRDNRLVSISAPGAAKRSLHYDDNGNLVDDGAGRTITWNALGQLTGVSGGGQGATYTYYPDGLRASKQVTGQSPVQFYYDHQKNANVINEIQASTKVAYQLAASRRMNRSVDGTVTTLFRDRKSVVASRTGDSVASQRFGAEGELNFPSGTNGASAYSIQDNPFAFAGEYRDAESGYYYLRARYYDPALMRFLSRDSIGVFNRYGYCATNPVMLFDPSGHAPWWSYLTMALAAVASVAVTAATGGALSWAAGGILEGASMATTTAVEAGIDATAAASGAIASDAVTAISKSIVENHWSANQFFNEDLGVDVLTSAAGAALGKVVKDPARDLIHAILGETGRMQAVARVLIGSVGSALDKGFEEGTKELIEEHRVDWKKLGEDMAESAAMAPFKDPLKRFGKQVKSLLATKIKGTYYWLKTSYGSHESELPTSPSVDTPKGVELLGVRHLEYHEDIDAPVSHATRAAAHRSASSDDRANMTGTAGFQLRRRSPGAN